MKTEYTKGFEAGRDHAREQILEYIQDHLAQEVDITVEDIANEVEYLQRKDYEVARGK